VAELRVKIICQEKTIMAMKMELKAAELQVEAKNKIDAKKTRLVELLDNKLQTVEKRNTKLLEMVEQMLKDKNASTDRLKEATRNMEDLSTRLVNSERTKNELTRVNTELRKMLDSLETKGSQIAKLAKEKVMKYVDANALMQQELTGLKDEAAATALQNSSEKAANYSGKASTHGEETACSELWNKIAELQKQITTALEKVDSKTATIENLQQTIQEAAEANTALGLSIEQVKQKTGEGLSAFSVENEQLRALVEEFDVARKEMERKEEKSRQLVNEQKESVDAKDKEIVELKEEVQRLKGAIGQLIGGK
jgi:chromosome segregation ATPase